MSETREPAPAAPVSDPTRPAAPFDVFDAHCPSRTVLTDVAKRWSVLVLGALGDGPHRFGQLTARIDGISERMLSETLKTLRHDGLVQRSGTEYALTADGQLVADRAIALFASLYTVLGER
jgi:DNA-binding HxlR family transcriptional regulator